MESATHTQEPLYELTPRPIDIADVVTRVSHPACGAVVTFIGTVRDHNLGRQVSYLDYEAYPEMAVETLEGIGAEIKQRWPSLNEVCIVHRIGRQEIGDVSVVIAISAGHREGIFDAGRYAIERIKQIVPIWKKEVWADGEEWIEGPRDVQPPTWKSGVGTSSLG